MSVSYPQEQIDAFLRQKEQWVRTIGDNFRNSYTFTNGAMMGEWVSDPDNGSIANIRDHTLGILESTLHSQVMLETMAMHLQNISDSLAKIAGQEGS